MNIEQIKIQVVKGKENEKDSIQFVKSVILLLAL